MRSARIALATLGSMLVIGGTAAHAATRMFQLPGAAGCILTAAVADCTQSDVGSPRDIVVRGTHAYVSDLTENRIRVYDRDPATGALTPRPASAMGCIDNEGAPCADARAFVNPARMTLNPDGTRLYVVLRGSRGVAVLTRDPASGALSQSPDLNACVTRDGSAAQCAIATSIDDPVSVAVSPDNEDVYLAGAGASNNGFVTALNVTAGGLAPRPAPSGCAENTPTAAGCLDARAMNTGRTVAISPDGKHVYVTSAISNAVTAFTRNSDGSLATIDGPDGCLRQDADQGSPDPEGCRESLIVGTEAHGLAFVSSGRAYVAGLTSGSLTLVERNATTGGLNTPGPCASSAGGAGPTAECTDVPNNMFGIVELEPVPGKPLLLVGSRFGRGLYLYELAADGAPSPAAAPAGCLATGGINFTTTCTIPRGFARVHGQDFGANGADVSEDGRFVYGASPQEFEDRAGIVAAGIDAADPVCESATVAVTAGAQAVLPLKCSDPDGDPLTIAIVSAPAQGVTGQVDQANRTVNYIAPAGFTGTQTLTFKGTSNGVDSAPATVTIDVMQQPGPPVTPPVDPPGTERLDPVIGGFFTYFRNRFTRVDILRVRKVPEGATVEVRCKGRGCPFKKRRFAVKKGRSNMTKPFKKRKLRKGVVLRVLVTKPGAIGEVAIWKVDNKRVPRKITRCLPPGARKPTRC